jgi:hypothetical protein
MKSYEEMARDVRSNLVIPLNVLRCDVVWLTYHVCKGKCTTSCHTGHVGSGPGDNDPRDSLPGFDRASQKQRCKIVRLRRFQYVPERSVQIRFDVCLRRCRSPRPSPC